MAEASHPKIKKEFSEALPPLEAKEWQALRDAIKEDGVVREPLDVWDGWLADGHHRLKIAKDLGVGYKTRELSVKKYPDESAVITWIIMKQIARRNLTPTLYAYYRGLVVNVTPSSQGSKTGQKTKGAAVKMLAAKAKVSESKVIKDAKQQKQVDKLNPSIKAMYLAEEAKLTAKELEALSNLPTSKQTTVERDVVEGHAKPSNGKSAWTVAMAQLGAAPKAKKPKKKPAAAFDPQQVVDAFARVIRLADEMHEAYPDKAAHEQVQTQLASAYSRFTVWAKKH